MPPRRTLFRWTLALPLVLGLSALGGCGWAPLYADRDTGPVDAELRAIRVAPIIERIGQNLALALRESLNPGGEATPQRYLLRTTLQIVRSDLGVQSLGIGTRGKLDVYAKFVLSDIRSNTALLSATSHAADSFDIQASGYATVVAGNDAGTRAVEELRRDIVSQLTVFLQRRAAGEAAKPAPTR
jgi:LPS-assembly lipoprotein